MARGIETVAVFLCALVVGQRSFRLTVFGPMLLGVGKILVLDVSLQNQSDRFVTFIILGILWLLVSCLYIRSSKSQRYL